MTNGFKEYMEIIKQPKEDAIQQVIEQSSHIIYKRQKHSSYGEFLRSQWMFLKPEIWIKQALCLSFGFLFTYLCVQRHLYVLAHYLLSLIPILIHILSVPLLMKSIDSKTLELEQVTYYRYRDSLLSKLFMIGLMNLFFISVLLIVSYGITALSLEQLILYTLVPYNISCCISLIAMLWMNQDRCIIDCMIINMISSLFLFLCSNTLYMEEMYLMIWKWMLLLSTCMMIVLIIMVIKKSEAYTTQEKRSE